MKKRLSTFITQFKETPILCTILYINVFLFLLIIIKLILYFVQ
jgi:hypothetical protein